MVGWGAHTPGRWRASIFQLSRWRGSFKAMMFYGQHVFRSLPIPCLYVLQHALSNDVWYGIYTPRMGYAHTPPPHHLQFEGGGAHTGLPHGLPPTHESMA